MWRLYHFPLCPFSRKVRLLLAEKQIAHELHEVLPWKHDPVYRQLSHTGQTPAMHDSDSEIMLIDSWAISEFYEETGSEHSLMIGSAKQRAEIRRLVAWFDERFYALVTGPLLQGRLIKTEMSNARADALMTSVRRDAESFLDEIGFLLDSRPWLAGPTLSLADLAAAAQISVADYLGGIDWSGHEQAKIWYSVLRSRRSFRPLLAERMGGIEPPPQYTNLNV